MKRHSLHSNAPQVFGVESDEGLSSARMVTLLTLYQFLGSPFRSCSFDSPATEVSFKLLSLSFCFEDLATEPVSSASPM